MKIIYIAVAFVMGIVACAFITYWVLRAYNTCRRKHRPIIFPITSDVRASNNKLKLEFTKIVVALVLLTYFIGVGLGIYAVFHDLEQLVAVLAYIGSPTLVAIGFYALKTKAENAIKIKKENPTETEGIPVDLNNINI